MTTNVVRPLIVILSAFVILVGLFVLLRPNAPKSKPQIRNFDLTIRDNIMDPSKITVMEGDRVVLRMISDSPVEVHLHGYHLEREVEPGESAKLSFEAKLTGRFEIEDHEAEEELGTLVVKPR